MLKVGLLGLGTIGKSHKGVYEWIAKENGPVKAEAFFDVSEELLADTGDARTYTNLDTFFAQEQGKLDYVDICLPTFLHKEVAIKAMRAGFHVLCEKPMALNSQEAQEMCDVAKQTGKKLMIAHILRFNGICDVMREIVQSGKLGKVHSMQVSAFGSGLPNGQNNWFKNNKLSGGPMLDVHVHDIDAINYILGKPEYVTAYAPTRAPGETYEFISSHLVYSNGAHANVTFDYAVPHNQHGRRTYRINFEKGYVLTNTSNQFVMMDESGELQDLLQKTWSMYNEILYFANCLLKGEPCELCLPEHSADTIRIIEAEIQSADQKGEKIFL